MYASRSLSAQDPLNWFPLLTAAQPKFSTAEQEDVSGIQRPVSQISNVSYWQRTNGAFVWQRTVPIRNAQYLRVAATFSIQLTLAHSAALETCRWTLPVWTTRWLGVDQPSMGRSDQSARRQCALLRLDTHGIGSWRRRQLQTSANAFCLLLSLAWTFQRTAKLDAVRNRILGQLSYNSPHLFIMTPHFAQFPAFLISTARNHRCWS